MNRPASSRVRWFLIFWLFVLSAVAFLDRVNISIAGSSIAAEFGLSNIQLGWVFSSFLVGYAVFQTLGGWLADRLGPRRVLTVGVLWWGIFTALTAAISSRATGALLFFIVIRSLLGAGEAVMYPASNQFVARWIPTGERGVANGVIFAGVGVGAAITPPIITFILIHYGWRLSFWISAFIGLLAGAVWYATSRDTPEAHAGVSEKELITIREGLDSRLSSVDGDKHSVSWVTILTSKEVWAVTLSYFCYGYVAWIFFSWFYIYLKEVRGLDLKASAMYGTLPFLAMAICCPLGGAISDFLTGRCGKRLGRCGIAVGALGLTAIFLFIGSKAENAQVASVVLAGGAGALYLSQSSFWSVTADIAGGSSGSVSGFMNMGAQFGGAVTASLTPLLAARFGWIVSFYVAAVLAAAGAVAWLFVEPSAKLAVAEQKTTLETRIEG
jgi:ACS family glucarate transporter-like MFS transporter